MRWNETIPNQAALATALDIWAASRERAVSHLSRRAARLTHRGCSQDVAHLRFAARTLSVRAVHERAQAAALRMAA